MNIYKPKLIHFEDDTTMIRSCTALIQEYIDEAVYNTGSCRIALAGGSTPKGFYSKFSLAPIDWLSCKFYQVDERYSPDALKASNQKMITSAMSPAYEGGAEFVTIDTSLESDACVKEYAAELDVLDCPMFDVVFLGIGKDGHIASLFPGGDYTAPDKKDELVIETTAPDGSQRISLNLKSILDTKHIIVYLIGEEKYGVLEELTSGTKKASEFPAKYLLAHPSVTIYFAEEVEES